MVASPLPALARLLCNAKARTRPSPPLLIPDSALLHLAHGRFFLPIFQDLTLSPPDRAIWEAHVQHGYSLTAIGQHLGLHYTTISKIVQRQQCLRTQKK